jgi:hypothetical protein
VKPGAIRDSNMTFTAPPGVDGCQDLLVRVDETELGRRITSAWIPTRAELARLNDGQPIHLHVYASGHPVVGMTVPED